MAQPAPPAAGKIYPCIENLEHGDLRDLARILVLRIPENLGPTEEQATARARTLTQRPPAEWLSDQQQRIDYWDRRKAPFARSGSRLRVQALRKINELLLRAEKRSGGTLPAWARRDEFPLHAKLCGAHARLDPWLVRELFHLLVEECVVQAEPLRRVVRAEWAERHPDAALRRVDDHLAHLNAASLLWADEAFVRRSFDESRLGCRVQSRGCAFARVESGCEACILAAVGGAPAFLCELRAAVTARAGRRRRRRSALLIVVDTWMDEWSTSKEVMVRDSRAAARAIRRVLGESAPSRGEKRKERRRGRREHKDTLDRLEGRPSEEKTERGADNLSERLRGFANEYERHGANRDLYKSLYEVSRIYESADPAAAATAAAAAASDGDDDDDGDELETGSPGATHVRVYLVPDQAPVDSDGDSAVDLYAARAGVSSAEAHGLLNPALGVMAALDRETAREGKEEEDDSFSHASAVPACLRPGSLIGGSGRGRDKMKKKMKVAEQVEKEMATGRGSLWTDVAVHTDVSGGRTAGGGGAAPMQRRYPRRGQLTPMPSVPEVSQPSSVATQACSSGFKGLAGESRASETTSPSERSSNRAETSFKPRSHRSRSTRSSCSPPKRTSRHKGMHFRRHNDAGSENRSQSKANPKPKPNDKTGSNDDDDDGDGDWSLLSFSLPPPPPPPRNGRTSFGYPPRPDTGNDARGRVVSSVYSGWGWDSGSCSGSAESDVYAVSDAGTRGRG